MKITAQELIDKYFETDYTEEFDESYLIILKRKCDNRVLITRDAHGSLHILTYANIRLRGLYGDERFAILVFTEDGCRFDYSPTIYVNDPSTLVDVDVYVEENLCLAKDKHIRKALNASGEHMNVQSRHELEKALEVDE